MKKNILVPEIGESITKGVIVDWLKKSGDMVKEGEGLFELETDKATVTVPATAEGRLEISAPKGSEVSIGQIVAMVDPLADSAEQPATAKPPEDRPAAPLSPSVKRIVTENKLDPAAIPGSGKEGRITKADALAQAVKPPEQPAAAKAPEIAPIVKTDTLTTRVRMTTLRKRTAERLVLARSQSVHVTTYNEIDMSAVMQIRSHHQEAFEKEHGIKLGFMSFFVKACCKALALHPDLNAMVDGEDIVYNNFYDIGVAISMDRGLVVPIVRAANTHTFAQIESIVADLAKRARVKQLMPDELTGGTFTITNGGVFGSLMSTPVPAYPQVAILGMHAIKKRAVVVDDAIVIRPMMYAALTYDHRIVDGREAIGFLVKVKEFIEQPDTLLLEM